MSDHGNTIRFALPPLGSHTVLIRAQKPLEDAYSALAALEAELIHQADRIAWLEGDVAGWRIRLAECEERHERRLSDAQSEAAARPD